MPKQGHGYEYSLINAVGNMLALFYTLLRFIIIHTIAIKFSMIISEKNSYI